MEELYPVRDGFTLSTLNRCNLRFRNLAIQEYESMRRAAAFRTKMWLTPTDSTILIPAFDSYERQIWMPAGSIIWGYTFIGNTGEQTGEEPAITGTQSWQIRDGCDDVALYSEVVTQQMYQVGRVRPVQQYLTKPLLIGPPGLLNVTLCNTYPTAQTGQLILYGGEPVL